MSDTLRVRLDDAHWRMFLELCQDHDRNTPDMTRKMIRDAHARLGKGKEMNTNHITAKWLKDAIENPSPDESYRVLPNGNIDRAYKDFNGTWYNVEYTPSGEKVRDTTPWSNVPF